MGRSTELGMFFVHRQGLFLSEDVDGIKMARKKQKIGSHAEEVDENVQILTNQRHFLTMCISGCTQRECKPNEDTVSQHREMFETTNFCYCC